MNIELGEIYVFLAKKIIGLKVRHIGMNSQECFGLIEKVISIINEEEELKTECIDCGHVFTYTCDMNFTEIHKLSKNRILL